MYVRPRFYFYCCCLRNALFVNKCLKSQAAPFLPLICFFILKKMPPFQPLFLEVCPQPEVWQCSVSDFTGVIQKSANIRKSKCTNSPFNTNTSMLLHRNTNSLPYTNTKWLSYQMPNIPFANLNSKKLWRNPAGRFHVSVGSLARRLTNMIKLPRTFKRPRAWGASGLTGHRLLALENRSHLLILIIWSFYFFPLLLHRELSHARVLLSTFH